MELYILRTHGERVVVSSKSSCCCCCNSTPVSNGKAEWKNPLSETRQQCTHFMLIMLRCSMKCAVDRQLTDINFINNETMDERQRGNECKKRSQALFINNSNGKALVLRIVGEQQYNKLTGELTQPFSTSHRAKEQEMKAEEKRRSRMCSSSYMVCDL